MIVRVVLRSATTTPSELVRGGVYGSCVHWCNVLDEEIEVHPRMLALLIAFMDYLATMTCVRFHSMFV
jgi:hypothetical protein